MTARPRGVSLSVGGGSLFVVFMYQRAEGELFSTHLFRLVVIIFCGMCLVYPLNWERDGWMCVVIVFE